MSHVGSWKEIEITKDVTIPKLFLQAAKKYWDKKVAMREKEFGIWIPITWKQYYENVKRIALGMVSLGLQRDDKVAMIWEDPKGMRAYDGPILISVKEVMKIGEEIDKKEPGLFEDLIMKGKGDEVCLLFYTSGTTALPKGALLTHYNMLTMGLNLMRVDPYFETDDFVSYLPFAWIGEQMMSISCGIQAGFTLNFPEEPETAQENIREIGPHVMFAPPRVYEPMVRNVQVKYLDDSWSQT